MREIKSLKITRGFTLIELLVVIAIIALLVSILLPSLNKAKELAKSAVCKSNNRTAATALNFYASDNNGILPAPYIQENLGDGYNFMWNAFLSSLGYISGGDTEDYSGHGMEGHQAIACPSALIPEIDGWEYTLGFVCSEYGWNAKEEKSWPVTNIRLEQIAKTPFAIVADSTQDYPLQPQKLGLNYYTICNGWFSYPILRHNGLSNVGMIDGSVFSADEAELRSLSDIIEPGDQYNRRSLGQFSIISKDLTPLSP